MNRIQPDTTLPKEPEIRTLVQRLTQASTENVNAVEMYKHGIIGGIWSRNTTGHYIFTMYTEVNEILALTCATYITGTVPGKIVTSWPSTDNTISVFTTDAAGTPEDGVLQQAIFKIDIFKQ